MRVTVKKSQRRIDLEKNDTSKGIQKYDSDNKYPQNIMIIRSNSGIGSSCIELYSKFIKGGGFASNGDRIVNKRGDTLNKVMYKAADDLALFGGYALHFNYNANYKISTITNIPFEFCRLSIPDDHNHVSYIAVYDDWGYWKNMIIKTNEIDKINVFNPDPAAIQAQVDNAGGFRNYKGQIFYFSRDGFMTYPVPSYDSIIEDMETDAGIKTYKYKAVKNGFSAFHMFVHRGGFESDDKRQEFVNNLNSFQGDENAGSIFLVEVEEGDEDVPEIKPFEMMKLDGVFDYTEKSIQDNIRRTMKIPPVLIGDLVVGRLGTAEEILDATILYNSYTKEERVGLAEEFTKIMKLYKQPIRSALTIEELAIISEESLAKRKNSIPQIDNGNNNETNNDK